MGLWPFQKKHKRAAGTPGHAPKAGQASLKASAVPASAATAGGVADETVNPCVTAAQYAVRGDIVARAAQIASDLGRPGTSYPFSSVVYCNIGNPQRLGQQPLTYIRATLSLCETPKLMDHPAVGQIFPPDVVARARKIISTTPGGTGAYSESLGVPSLRAMVAQAVAERDGCSCSPDDIFMLDGASAGVHSLMRLLLRPQRNDAMMVPIPQYPLYSATLVMYGGSLVPYHLDEEHGWELNLQEMKKQLATAKSKGVNVRAVVVINPGNPTGQCLSYQNQADIAQFCAQEGLLLVADEVYQCNIYAKAKKFTSFKRVAHDLGLVGKLPLVSLHSTSKGFHGECGRRGGYMELTGLPASWREQLVKLASINLCPNISGQIACALMMCPPKEGEPSYQQYIKEKSDILASLARRASLLVTALNKLEGVACNDAEGALYTFPRITLPPKAMDRAKELGKAPDWVYCMELLEATGIVVVPGSGFGQVDGTYHFRTTFLPSEGDIGSVVQRLSKFHASFLAKYK